MAIKTGLPQLDVWTAHAPHGTVEVAGVTLGFLALSLIYYFYQFVNKYNSFPELKLTPEVLNQSYEGKRPDQLALSRLLREGAEKFKRPFLIKFPDMGSTIILPPQYTDDVKNNQDMSLHASSQKDFFPHIPGFDAIRAGNEGGSTFQDAVRIKLTQALGYFTTDLSDEANKSLPEILPVKDTWETMTLYPSMLDYVCRLSSLIFMGREFDKIREWQEISASYTVNMFNAARILRRWHPLLRDVVHWFLPETTRLRAQVRKARSIIEPEVQRRRLRRQEAIKNGTHVAGSKSLDSVDWFEDTSKGQKFDFVAGELALSAVAIHTTTGTLTNIMLDLCENPQYIDELRQEIISVVREENGLQQKTTLYKMKLMDSILKESQRLHPLGQATLRRRVMKKVTLHDGTVLPEGSYTLTGPLENYNPEVFPDPYKFDAHRFLRLRAQPGGENKWQFVSTQPEHLGFGHGMHACPGRFFASNEIKIALMHLVMKYDWKLVDGQSRMESLEMGTECPPHPQAQLMYRARTAEVSL